MSVASIVGGALDLILGVTVTGRNVDVWRDGDDVDIFGAAASTDEGVTQLVIENIPVPDDTAVIEIDLNDDDIAGLELVIADGIMSLTISRIESDWI